MAKSKVFSLIYGQLVMWFKNTVWPWFVTTVWPDIKSQMNDIFAHVSARAKAAFDEWMNSRSKTREEAARKRAADAEAMAQNSQTESEAQKHRAVAEVWRQVAEQFRQENEELKAKLNEVLEGAASDFRVELNSMDVKNVIQEGDNGTLRLPYSGTALQLPEPSDHL